jgi:threonyl-tRNA synthetase
LFVAAVVPTLAKENLMSQSQSQSEQVDDVNVRRSHRWLGEQLGLFHFPEHAPGMPCWHAPGMVVWNELARLWRELGASHGYEEVRSPLVCARELWERSGHWEKFRDKMFVLSADEREFALKPMNCPGHADLYALRPRSYKELPLRFAEMGHCHRLEPSGSLNGLLRVRAFAQDDAHLFCRPAQAQAEAAACLEMAKAVYALFGLPLRAELSLRPPQRLGADNVWEEAEAQLRGALESSGLQYEERAGEGSFYGPKVDLHIDDALGRSWQMGSVQMDFQLPIRFDLRYINEKGVDVDANGAAERPVMVHRAIFGSFERFIGILLEHYDGQFPLWLAPEAVAVLPVSADVAEYAQEVAAALANSDVRARVHADGPLGARIRDAELARIPLMAVVGAREHANQSVNLRARGQGQQQMALAEAVAELEEKVRSRALS